MNLVELFSGIGTQVQSLKNIGVNVNNVNTCDWCISSIIGYDIIHNNNDTINNDYTKEELIDKLSEYNLSNDGSKPITKNSLKSMSQEMLLALYKAIENNNNLVDISKIHYSDFSSDNIDLMTYSFPCTDLSAAGQGKGIDKDSETRSGLLWQVERLLKEAINENRTLPKVLLMENVVQLLQKKHKDNFKLWTDFLVSIGYYNKVYTLNSKNFASGQNRNRCFMISIFTNNDKAIEEKLDKYFLENDLEQYRDNSVKIKDVLIMNKYIDEQNDCTMSDTHYSYKIMENNKNLSDNECEYCGTVTTKQYRNPNSGYVEYHNSIPNKIQYRLLTPREQFLLMGFKEADYERLIDNNILANKSKYLFNKTTLERMAGNAIVINVLEKIMKQIDYILNNNFI